MVAFACYLTVCWKKKFTIPRRHICSQLLLRRRDGRGIISLTGFVILAWADRTRRRTRGACDKQLSRARAFRAAETWAGRRNSIIRRCYDHRIISSTHLARRGVAPVGVPMLTRRRAVWYNSIAAWWRLVRLPSRTHRLRRDYTRRRLALCALARAKAERKRVARARIK